MMRFLCSPVLALAMIAPAAGFVPASTHPSADVEAAGLHARFDPSLASMRAGRVDTSRPLSASERTRLEVASQHAAPLAALRAGSGPTDQQWTWIAIGAAVVLILILI